MPTGSRREERIEAQQELQRFEARLPELARVITPEAATLAWLMLGDKMWSDGYNVPSHTPWEPEDE